MRRATHYKSALLLATALTALTIFLASNLLLLDKDPVVNVDEPWISDAAHQFAETGRFSPVMFQGKHYNLEGRYRWTIHQLLLAVVFKIGGFGLYQARLVSFLSGLAALCLLFLLGKRLYDRSVGILAVNLFAFSPIYEVSRIARGEMLLTVFILASVYAAVVGIQRRSGWLLAASGLISALGCAVHLNGLAVVCAIGLLFLTHFRASILRIGGLASYVAGAAVAAICWVLVYGLVLTEVAGTINIVPRVTRPWEFLVFSASKLVPYSDHFHGGPGHNVSVMTALIVVSIYYLARRRSSSDKIVLTIPAVFIAFYAFVSMSINPHYLVYVFPFLFIAVASTVIDATRSVMNRADHVPLNKRIPALAMLIVTIGWGGVRAADDIVRAYRARGESGYDAYIGRLKRFIPPGAVIMGQPTWYYGFHQQPYYADRYFAWIARTHDSRVREKLGGTFSQALRRAGVEYLILDTQLTRRMHRPDNDLYGLPLDQVIPFLEEQCVLVGAVEEGVYADGMTNLTKIYKVKDPVDIPAPAHQLKMVEPS